MIEKSLLSREFSDYRQWLGERYRNIKATDRKFSQRYISQHMGTTSSGWFADVLAGRQKLKLRQVKPLSKVFKLNPEESKILRILVTLESAESPEEKNEAYSQWVQARGITQTQIKQDQFKYFERWYYPVLRELLILNSSDATPAALGAALHPPMDTAKVREALRVLSRLGLMNPDAPAPVLVKQAAKTPHWRTLLEAYMNLARPALALPKEERDFSALTVSLSPESLREAGEEIAALRQRLLILSKKDAGKNRVYQCLFQVFPVSQTVEINHV